MLSRTSVPLLLAATLSLAACSSEKPGGQPLTPVNAVAVENYAAGEGPRYSATIAPYAQVSLAFKSSGYVTKILQVHGADGKMRNADPGDWITGGQVLATVREDDYRNNVARLTASLAQANAAAQNARQDFDRDSALLAANALTQPAYDSAKAQLDSSAASVTAIQAELTEAQLTLSDCSLVAPMDGWVTARNVEVGDLASSGTVGFTLVNTRQVKAVFGLPDTLLGSIHLGQPQTVSTEALAEDFQGRITMIAPQADPKARVFPVEVTIPNPKDLLKVGMVATLALGGAARPPVPVIPLSAIVSPADGSKGFAVFVITHDADHDVARQRRVEIGDTFGDRVAVLRGLALGDRVVSVGATQIQDGQPVRILP
jgi:multidrug efflux system membrane fusion protein